MFYTFRQNNSGGKFEIDEARGISTFVIVEAGSEEEAIARAEGLGLYFHGGEGRDCPCCGDRWSVYDAESPTTVPCVYDEPIETFVVFQLWAKGKPEGFVHYLDGQVEAFTPAIKRGKR